MQANIQKPLLIEQTCWPSERESLLNSRLCVLQIPSSRRYREGSDAVGGVMRRNHSEAVDLRQLVQRGGLWRWQRIRTYKLRSKS